MHLSVVRVLALGTSFAAARPLRGENGNGNGGDAGVADGQCEVGVVPVQPGGGESLAACGTFGEQSCVPPQQMLLQKSHKGIRLQRRGAISANLGVGGQPSDTDIGCFAEFFAEEDLHSLRTSQDAFDLLVKYCAEDHDRAFCESLAESTFEAGGDVRGRALTQIHRAVPLSVAGGTVPGPLLCKELRSLQRAEEAWLEGQRTALGLRRLATSADRTVGSVTGAETDATAQPCPDDQVNGRASRAVATALFQAVHPGDTVDSTLKRKTCGKECRACRRRHGQWRCADVVGGGLRTQRAAELQCGCSAEVLGSAATA